MEWTNSQEDIVKQIVWKTAKVRQKIIMYKVYDNSLALFRVQAFNHISDLIVSKATNQPYPKASIEWVNYWDDNSAIGNDIQNIFRIIDNFKI